MGAHTTSGHIHIVGIGVAHKAQLSEAACRAITHADKVIGSARQLHTIDYLLSQCERTISTMQLPALSALGELIDTLAGKIIVVLASGDPLYYGIGRWFATHYPREQLSFYPAISSIQAACHQLGIALQDVKVLSLHGRALEKIRTQLRREQYLVILTDKNSQPRQLAQECIAAGFAQSQLTVCENLGYPQQRIRTFSVAALLDNADISVDPLHISILHVAGVGGVLPEFPGIPDAHYITGAQPGKGMITKREVRLVILSMMQPTNNDVIWDVGAGCGGVAIELAYWNERVTVYAIEQHAKRREYISANRERFGVGDNLHVIAARAPAALNGLPAPTKIFIGGSDGELDTLLTYAWQRLPDQGVLVVSAVTASSKAQLSVFAQHMAVEQQADIESTTVAITRGSIASGQASGFVYQTKKPVEIFKLTKHNTERKSK